MDALRELGLLESRDVLTRRFQEAHKRAPNATKCRQIAAHLLQGRQYWESASQAGDLIRPLLLYYGSLSFSRALILFTRVHGGEETLSNSHGLQAMEWVPTFAKGGVGSVLDFGVTVTSGTMTELAEATQNRERSRVYIGPFPTYREILRPGTVDGIRGTRVTIRELIKRVPGLADTYERVTGERSAAYPVIPFEIRDSHIDLNVLTTDRGPKNWTSLRGDIGIPESITIEEGVHPVFGRTLRTARLRVPWDGIPWLYPHLAVDSSGASWAISSIGDGQHWNQLSTLFTLSFCLGMLVRYHPTIWFDISSQLRGDVALPLLREARIAIEETLPRLIVEHIELRTFRRPPPMVVEFPRT